MSQQSAIEWTDATWNPVTGCDRVSPGCDHCYALDLAARLKAMGQQRYQKDGKPPTSGPGFGLTVHEDKINAPLRWRKPRMVFVNSMSDLFHPKVPTETIGRIFNVMGSAPQHTFQVLTKRPKRMAALLSTYYEVTEQEPFPNVWLGTSIESREYVGRADQLRATPAAVRFISAEPLLGPLLHDAQTIDAGRAVACWLDGYRGKDLDLSETDWLIVGGESGPHHRPPAGEWIRSLRDFAVMLQRSPVQRAPAFFFKQWGGRTPKAGGRELDGRTWDEMPDA